MKKITLILLIMLTTLVSFSQITTATQNDENRISLPPPNDTLAGAIPITPSADGSTCTAATTFTLNFTTDGTTDSGINGSCNATGTGLDQFFTWTATSTGLIFNSQSLGNPGIVIRDTSGTEIDCVSAYDDGFLFGWAIGDDLIIQIYTFGSSPSDVTFCLQEATQAPNDTLAGAIPIIPSAEGSACTTATTFTLNFSTEGTTDSGIDSCHGSSTGLDQFFTWTATSTGLFFRSQSPGNPGIVIRDTSGIEIDCAGTSSRALLSGWAIGDDLIIQIYDLVSSFSDVAFCLQEATQAPNDTLAGAIPITPSAAGSTCTTATTFTLDFTTGGTTDSGMDGSCNTTGTGLDQFFTWTATSTGLIFNSQSPGNPGIVIRDTSGTEIDCVSTASNRFLSGWVIGDELIIQIYDFGSSLSDVTFCLKEATQVPNDTLAGAIPITPSADGSICTTATTFTLNFTTDGTTDSGMDGSCNGSSTGLDQFFTWTATSTGLIFKSSSLGFPGIVIRDTSGIEIDCAGTLANTFLSGWEIGDDLIIQIYDSASSFSDVAFCLQEATQAPNDTLAGAIPIIPATTGSACALATAFTLNFTTEGTTDSGMNGSCNGSSTGVDQFFTWTATSTGLIFRSQSSGYPGIVIRDTSGTEIDCASTFANAFLSGWSIGDDLIIQIYDSGNSLSDVVFCLQEATQAPNDTLAGAIPITPATAGTTCTTATTFTLNFSTEGTTDSGIDGSCNGSSTGLDQFFTWTATTNGLIFNSRSPGYPGIVIRDTSGTEIDCDSSDAFLSGWSIGDDLIIQIYDTGSFFSDVAFCLQEVPILANDDCENATTVESLPFNETLDATYATNNGGFITSCDNGMNDGVWYTFTTIDAGTIDIAISGTDWDAELALYTGSCGAFTCVSSADSPSVIGDETLSGVSVTAATQYWINLGYYSNSNDGSEGSFTINISTSDTTTLMRTLTWTGSVDTDWATAGNWDAMVAPTVENTVVIPNVANKPIISATTGAVAYDLIVDVASSLTINGGGSLIVSGTSSGNITYKRNLATTNWYLVSSPVSGETIQDLIASHTFATGTGGKIGLAPYNNMNSSWAYQQSGSTGNLVDGQGYSVKLNATGDISFSGTLNTDDVMIALTQGAGGGGDNFGLLGNPFTSFIDSNDFLTTNTVELTSQTIWLWNQATGSYDTKVTADAFKIAPGQGFFVEANTTNNVTFSESIQGHKTADTFQRTSRPEVHLFLNDDENNSRYSKIYYIDNTTTGFDNGYDGELFGGVQNSFELYTHLLSDNQNKKYQIQSLPNSEYESMVIPVGIKADAGKEITFSAETMNLPTDLKVFLEDRNENIFTRLDEANTEYTITLSEELDGVGRFYIHTSASALTVNDVTLNTINIYKSDISTVRIAGLPQGNTSVKIYNVLGKEILNTTFQANGVKDISVSKLATGIYIVRVQTELGTLNKKIILEY